MRFCWKKARQNDELTLLNPYIRPTCGSVILKESTGSHTIIRTRGTGEAPETTMMQAAKLAAYYSKARNSSKVPVDYTLIKNVKA